MSARSAQSLEIAANVYRVIARLEAELGQAETSGEAEDELPLVAETGEDLAERAGMKLDTLRAPFLGLIDITKIRGRARTVEHNQLPELLFSFQHVAQSRAQRRDARSHRNKYEITSFHCIEIEAMSGDSEQFDLVTNTHVVDHGAGAHFLLYQNLQITILRRAGKSKVSRLFAFNSQHRNLPWREIDYSVSTKIKRARGASLITNFRNHERLRFFELHRFAV